MLQTKLDTIRKNFESQAPAEALAVMHRATDDLAASGQAASALGEGSAFPDFSLTDTDGNTVTLSETLKEGPVVVTFFRGHW